MILPFSTHIFGKPTYFAEKICKMLYFIHSARIDHSKYPLLLDICNRYVLTKIHTIRTDSKNRWKAGCLVHPVYHNRTKEMYQFAPTFECTGTQSIEIKYFYHDEADAQAEVWIDGKLLIQSEIELLAKNDGFENADAFFLYFNTDFKGKIIHFTNFRY